MAENNNNGTIELLHSAKVESLEHGNNETAGKRKLDGPGSRVRDDQGSKRRKGTARIREEYLIHVGKNQYSIAPKPQQDVADDDAAEAFHHRDRAPARTLVASLANPEMKLAYVPVGCTPQNSHH